MSEFDFKVMKTSSQTHDMLRTATGGNVTGRTPTFKWFSWIEWGKTSPDVCVHSNCLSRACTDQNWQNPHRQQRPVKYHFGDHSVHILYGHTKWILRQDRTCWASPCNMYHDCSSKQQRQHVFVQQTIKITNHNFFWMVTKGGKLGFSVMTPKPNIRNNWWTFHMCSDRNAQSTV